MAGIGHRGFMGRNRGGSSPITEGSPSCWSVRKINPLYTGYAMRVRRSSDDTELDIGFSGSDLDTTSLLSFVGIGNGFVSVFYDQKNTYDFLQTDVTAQPKIVDSGSLITENGKPAIYFDGARKFMQTFASTSFFKFLHDGTRSALVFVAKLAVSSPTKLYIFLSNNYTTTTTGIYYAFEGRSGHVNASAITVSRGAAGLTAQSIEDGSWTHNIQTLQFLDLNVADITASERLKNYENGGLNTAINSNTNTPSSGGSSYNLTLGAFGSVINNYFFVGPVQEIITYNTDQLATRAGIQTNINDYYTIY